MLSSQPFPRRFTWGHLTGQRGHVSRTVVDCDGKLLYDPRLTTPCSSLKDFVAMVPRPPLEPSPRDQACDLCDGTQFEILDRLDRRQHPLTTVICRHCGLVSHEQIPDEHALDRYYQIDYRQDYHGEISPAPHRVVRAWQGGQWLFDRLKPYVPRGSRVCEIGAGIGCTVKVFELAGYQAEGIEPGVGFHRFAQDQLRAKVRRCNLYDLPAQRSYDFMLLVHVIEHFRSPKRALQSIHTLLRDDGQLYVECPNLGASRGTGQAIPLCPYLQLHPRHP